MDSSCHEFFDNLDFYLIPQLDTLSPTNLTVTFHWSNEEKGLFNVWGTDLKFFKTGDLIVFTTKDPTLFPLPDPAFLLVRAMVAKIRFPRGGGIANELDEWYHEPDGWEHDESAYSASPSSSSSVSPLSSSSSHLTSLMRPTPALPTTTRAPDDNVKAMLQEKIDNSSNSYWLNRWLKNYDRS